MTEVDGEALTGQESSFMEQTRDAVHLDQILDIDLLTQSLKCHVELLVFTHAITDPSYPLAAPFEAATRVFDKPEEAIGEVGCAEFASALYASLKSFSGPISSILCAIFYRHSFSFLSRITVECVKHRVLLFIILREAQHKLCYGDDRESESGKFCDEFTNIDPEPIFFCLHVGTALY